MDLLTRLITRTTSKSYIIGTHYILQRCRDGWEIISIEGDCLFWSPPLEPAAEYFIEQETEQVVEALLGIKNE